MLQNDSVQIYIILFIFLTLAFGYTVYRKNKKGPQKSSLRKSESAVDFQQELADTIKKTETMVGSKPEQVTSQTEQNKKVLSDSNLQNEKEIESQKTVTQALVQTKKSFFDRLQNIFSKDNKDYLEDIEEVLYTSDLGPQTVQKLLSSVTEGLSTSQKANADLVGKLLNQEMKNIFSSLKPSENSIFQNQLKKLSLSSEGPTVWLIVGVNGAGKTTTIGKLSALAAEQNKKVIVAAGDTFRAAAQNQLKVWTERAQVEIFDPPQTLDPSAVAFDAVQKAKAQNYDLVIIDTAGRLHTQAHLMDELKKVKRVIQKVMPEAPHEVLLVLDGNSGQNALIQAKEFNQALGVTGVTLTKMDGTAKGGVAVGIAHELKIPIKLIGIGEKIGDLREFEPNEFVDSII